MYYIYYIIYIIYIIYIFVYYYFGMNVLRWCPFVHLLDTLIQNSPYGHVTLSSQKQQFVDVIQNRCSYKFLKIHRKTPVLEYLFKKF